MGIPLTNQALYFQLNGVNCLYNSKEESGMQTDFREWSLGAALVRWYQALTHHYAIQTPTHVGAFAGSLLERRDWDHN